MRMIKNSIYAVVIAVVIFTYACAPAGGEKRGHEFMPDMVHSTAYEANIYDYYYYNTWGSEEEYKAFTEPRLPVKGTIPRGYVALAGKDDIQTRTAALEDFRGGKAPNSPVIPPNGAVPYYYENSEEGRTKAMEEITENPLPITEEGLAKGMELYTIYCGICHGPKAEGLGYLVREANPARGITAGVYPAQPANLMLEDFVNASEGQYYHSIMYGRNMMGAYADKLSYEERWQVIHYIRSLQAKALGKAYNADENTLNTAAVPGNTIAMGETMSADSMQVGEPGQLTDEDHSPQEGQH